MILKWAWHCSKLPQLVFDLVSLRGISIVIALAVRTTTGRKESANIDCWIVLWSDGLPSALLLKLLHPAQPLRFLPRYLLLHLPVVLVGGITSVAVGVA